MAILKIEKLGLFKHQLLTKNGSGVIYFNKGEDVPINIDKLISEDIEQYFELNEKEHKTFNKKRGAK